MIDVLVAGAGPTGLAAAIAAAREGLEVVVLDPRAGTIDKACGEGLMPPVVDALHALGVRPHGRPFAGVRYIRGDVVAEGRFERPGLGVRRTVLHEALARAAAEAGVRREVGRVEGVEALRGGVRAGGFEARWLIAADGLRSTVRRALDLDLPVRAARRYGVRRHFAIAPWSRTVDVHWADDAEAYVTPVDERLVGVALLFGDGARGRRGDGQAAYDRLLGDFPGLLPYTGEPVGAPRGAGPFAVRSRRRVLGRVLLVGDAAGYVDPLTGEGTKLGILGARAAVEALVRARPEDWEVAWRRLWRPYAWTTGGLLALTRSPRCRGGLPRLLRAAPWLFDRALGVLAT